VGVVRKYKADEKLGVEVDRIQFDPVNNCFIERKDEGNEK